jgi:D-alanine-D-alanine ligase
MKLAVLLGGTSAEREISFLTGNAMARAYESLGHEVTLIDPATGQTMSIKEFHVDRPHAQPPTAEEVDKLTQGSIFVDSICSKAVRDADAVVIGLHGVPGEDGSVQAVLELLGKKFTGSGSRSSAIAIDKAYTKILMTACGIRTPRWGFLSKSSSKEDYQAFEAGFQQAVGEKIVVKPNDQGSTVGLTLSTQADFDFRSSCELAWKYSNGALIEEFIEGRELTVGVLAGKVLPVVEIAPEGGFYDYHHKYTKGMTNYYCPAELDESIAYAMQTDALRLHNACDCSGYSRVDFRMNANNEFFCLEINTLPGMTETSLVPKAAQAAGLSFEELCRLILEEATR